MAERGHNLTVLSPIKETLKTPNAHYIHLEGVYHYANKNDSFDLLNLADEGLMQHIFTTHEYCEGVCQGILVSNGFQQLLDYPDDFKVDLVCESLILTDFYKVLKVFSFQYMTSLVVHVF